MKIIDLLNKIANGEEPKIKYDNHILKYNKNEEKFIDKDGLNSLYEIDFSELNDEVEIIEEPKKIEKLAKNITDNACSTIDQRTIANKINEIIDEINEMKEGK